ncbi:MAG: DUF5597 domain-containing protein [bacterium]|jgi:beta-galactosidase GanA|nr:DUF5597 domain-containing protein [candidate division KSB1 bacterium]MDH7560896.1 DUF5597 domain-containing protein [bacterium]
MKLERTVVAAALSMCVVAASVCGAGIPRLAKQGGVVQLLVDDKPFLILGGELGNSTASDLRALEAVWPKCAQLGMNTVLAPVYWEMLEPQEGVYDSVLVDSLLVQARRHGFRLVLLWFGSWKNSMSCYAPLWVKADPDRFPRARERCGRPLEILSPFYEANREADARAFRNLMAHLRKVDGNARTVVMVQVENEVGMIPDPRDYGEKATALFASEVPAPLIQYLVSHRENLRRELIDLWRGSGFRTSGTWEEVFGKGERAEELFMAWHLCRYVDEVAAAGKEEYPLPMFVNAALNRPGYRPGEYPSGGPVPHLLDIWRAGAQAIDFFAPDIYFADFANWCEKYTHAGNPLFVPEANRGDQAAVYALYAVGQHDALGFSPFAVESIADPGAHPLREAYRLLRELAPILPAHAGRGKRVGVLLSQDKQTVVVNFDPYALSVAHDFTFKWARRPENLTSWPEVGGLILRTAPDEFIVAGSGILVTFSFAEGTREIAGIAQIDEGTFVGGRFVPRRRLNGDESHQGRHLRIPSGQFGIQRVRLYRYW